MSFDLQIVNGDLSIANNGDLAIVEDVQKLIQDILKMCITPAGALAFYPWFGSVMSRGLIGSVYDDRFLTSTSISQLTSSLNNLKALQLEQAKTSQPITPGEHIAAIKSIDVQRSTNDPRYFAVYVSVITKALTKANTSFTVGI
jgi:hypothetical protein